MERFALVGDEADSDENVENYVLRKVSLGCLLHQVSENNYIRKIIPAVSKNNLGSNRLNHHVKAFDDLSEVSYKPNPLRISPKHLKSTLRPNSISRGQSRKEPGARTRPRPRPARSAGGQRATFASDLGSGGCCNVSEDVADFRVSAHEEK